MTGARQAAQRIRRGVVCGMTVLAAAAWARSRSGGEVDIVAFANPAPAVLNEIATNPGLDVRWAESGLVVAEVMRPDLLRPEWDGRIVARRADHQELAVLRRAELDALGSDPQHAKALAWLAAARVAEVSAASGDLLLLVGEPGSWPAELLGCHGGLVVAPHQVDPRSLLDSGPPDALLPWLLAPQRPPTARQRRLLDSVSADSLAATMKLLTRDESGLYADRYVFSSDLANLYGPRVEAAMQRAVQGIAATVAREPFLKRRRCPGGVLDTTSTYNLVARIQGSVPGTGTFVVCAHLDATGSRNPTWVQAARTDCASPPPAAGGEDNATGVSCVVEMLRGVAAAARDVEFAVDLEFVAFSGEEAEGIEGPLTGSEVYVASRVAAGTNLLGALNMDMVGSDSLGNNLQIVHNTASSWLADLVVAAGSALQPPTGLDYTQELDEQLASDHNNFWRVNAPAILAADAGINVLRSYATYHRPLDTGLDRDVRVGKMAEVARTLLAALLRFDTRAHTGPDILFPSEGLQLFLTVQGAPTHYDTHLRLWPGSSLAAQASVYGLGATYAGPLRVEMWIENAMGQSRRVFECSDADCYQMGGAPQPALPTGGRLEFVLDPVPIRAEDGGTNRLLAQVTYTGSAGDSVQAAAESFVVAEQEGLQVRLLPNPLRGDPALAQVELPNLERAGELRIDVYNFEGELVSGQVLAVEPLFRVQASEEKRVDLLAASARGVTMQSGTYFVRVRWTGPGGQEESAVRPLVVIR